MDGNGPGYPGGETGGGRLVRDRQVKFAGQRANPLLADPGIEQRRADSVGLRRQSSGTEVAGVVGVRAVKDGGEPALVSEPPEPPVELALAVKTAVRSVSPIVHRRQFVRRQPFMGHGVRAENGLHERFLVFGEARADTRDREAPVSENPMGEDRQRCAVHASAESDHRGAALFERVPESVPGGASRRLRRRTGIRRRPVNQAPSALQ